MKHAMDKTGSLNLDTYHGYTKPGDELFGKVAEMREAIDWSEGRAKYIDDLVPGFNSSVQLLNEKCKSVAKLLYQLLAIGLELDDINFFIKRNLHWVNPTRFTGMTNLRIAHYPKISKDIDISHGATRISEHTDFATLTLLFQDETGGLEVKDVNGYWIPVQPIHDAIVINTGDLLEYWTSGIWQATVKFKGFLKEFFLQILILLIAASSS
jgi:isopenicillin N synthase-like dioxygenase